uniref:Uncharacterized protein n=1 Tax=Clytia hemisphaerica TaxID=252671 RepID=A0A7M5XLM5_9CNID
KMANVEISDLSCEESETDLDESLSDNDDISNEKPLIVTEEDLTDGTEDAKLVEIPKLVFVNEKNVTLLVEQDIESIPAYVFGKALTLQESPNFECPHCGKPYVRTRYYKNHLDLCDKNKSSTNVKATSSSTTVDNNDDVDDQVNEELIQRGITYLSNAFEEAIVYQYHNLAEPGISVGKLARSIKTKILSLKPTTGENEDGDFDNASDVFRKYGYHLLSIFEDDLVKDGKTIIKKTSASFRKFYNYCV